MGMPISKISLDTIGAFESGTFLELPEITIPFGFFERISSIEASQGRISLYTRSSLILLAMSCVY
jgi:hypothetical protein